MTQTVALRVVIVTSIERKSRSRVVNEEELRLLLVFSMLNYGQLKPLPAPVTSPHQISPVYGSGETIETISDAAVAPGWLALI